MSAAATGPAPPPRLTPAHRRRLREVWRSAGWPCHDNLELDLLAAGLLLRHWDGHGRETLRVTDAGVALLAAARQRQQAARDAHEALVERVARQMQHAGRIVWRGLSLRAPLLGQDGATRWVMAMPDVFSIRHTTREDSVEPVAHEIKVSRADLLSDLRRPDKGLAYAALAGEAWYVLREGIGDADDVPPPFGVMSAGPKTLEVLRPAGRRPMQLAFGTWMALVRHGALPAVADDEAQAALTPVDAAGGPESKNPP